MFEDLSIAIRKIDKKRVKSPKDKSRNFISLFLTKEKLTTYQKYTIAYIQRCKFEKALKTT